MDFDGHDGARDALGAVRGKLYDVCRVGVICHEDGKTQLALSSSRIRKLCVEDVYEVRRAQIKGVQLELPFRVVFEESSHLCERGMFFLRGGLEARGGQLD